MKNAAIRTLFILAALMVSVGGAFAQVYSDDGLVFPSPGGVGSGGDDGTCKTCNYATTTTGFIFAVCESRYDVPYPGGFHVPKLAAAYSSCQAHNAPVGPPFCETLGYCVYVYDWVSDRGDAHSAGRAAEYLKQQADGIASFLRGGLRSDGSRLISDADADDFEALTIKQSSEASTITDRELRRLNAYRDKFSDVMHAKLTPGRFPVAPERKSPKTPEATVASR